MLDLESDDTLPRTAPQPCVPPALDEASSCPVVPEISILYAPNLMKPTTSTLESPMQYLDNDVHQSYASWKKHVMPKITYPQMHTDVANGEICEVTLTNDEHLIPLSMLYPLRTKQTINCLVTNTGSTPFYYGEATSHNSTQDCMQYNTVSQVVNSQIPDHTYRFCKPHDTSHILDQPRSYLADENTVSTGTQTEEPIPALNLTITKDDFSLLFETINNIRSEQLRLTNICNTLLHHHNQINPSQLRNVKCYNDVASQCEILDLNKVNSILRSEIPVLLKNSKNQNTTDESSFVGKPTKNNLYNQLKQNQELLACTPNNNEVSDQQEHSMRSLIVHQNMMDSLPRPISEKSMVMNQLALKYLPSEKLSQMMREIQLTTQSVSHIPNISDFDKCEKNRYLKINRMQVENNGMQEKPSQSNCSPLSTPILASPTSHEYLMLDLDHCRHQSKLL